MSSETSKYLTFDRHDPTPPRKTPMIVVSSKRSGDLLGFIRWYGPWRQFCFWPQSATIFNTGCMDDIKAVIAELHAERAA